jgi:signal transduction histidine kinase
MRGTPLSLQWRALSDAAALVGGDLRISSVPGHGTEVEAML